MQKFLNQNLEVIIDRPLGSKHPKFKFEYPINYGYIPNTLSGDNEEIDAYVLGVDKPIKQFKGKCIAIIKRLNDNEDKLVIAPNGKNFTKDEIEKLTHFQEKWFKIEIIM